MSTACAIDRQHGWRRTNLGDVAEFIMGQAPPGSASNFEGKGTVFVKAGEFGPSHPIIREWTTKPLRFARSGDVLICVVGATAGKLNLGIDCAIGRSVAAIRPAKEILDRFLYLQLQPKVNELRAASMGSAQGVINKQMLADIEVLVPTIDEQREVVAEIEKQFTRLEAGVAGLRRVRANLKRYRAAVLKAACEGKLVPTEAELARQEGRTYETAAQLLDRIIAERREEWNGKGKYKEPAKPDTTNLLPLPEGWVYTSVQQVGFVQLGRQRSPKHHLGEFMRPYLRVANVFEDRIDTSDVMRMNFTPAEYETYRLKPNDILLNEGQSLDLVGRPALYRDEVPGGCFQNTLVRFRTCNHLIPKFALIVFRAFMHTGRFQKIARWTVNIAHLGADRFSQLAFPLPPVDEQRRIISEVERSLSVVEELEAVVSGNLQRAGRLRQSILDQAFKGNSYAMRSAGLNEKAAR